MKNLVYICMVMALISMLVGVICSFQGVYFLSIVTPRALLILANVTLLFGVNFGLLAMIK